MSPPSFALAIRTLLYAALLAPLAPAGDVLVGKGSLWSYLDDGSDPGAAWPDPTFDDSTWGVGAAQLGYGDDDEVTLLSFGPDPDDKHITTYFRHAFSVADPTLYTTGLLEVVRDDGVVVYLNGAEVARSNMPAGPIDSGTAASSVISGSGEDLFQVFSLAPGALNPGSNVLAVELHQSSGTSSDVSFDLELTAAAIAIVDRGPFLQSAGSDRITVSWRTNLSTGTRVWYGSAPGSLTSFVDGPAATKHDVTLSGLLPDTTYFYAVGTPAAVLAGDDGEHRFHTPPPPGTRAATRIWVTGDSGTSDVHAAAVRDAYLAHPGAPDTDLWLMLGDNAYDSGTNEEYQSAVFEMYPDLLRRTPLWPTRGNHDTTGAYFGIFTLPTAGESGGLASGTESYYSFDHANLHLVCLDSWASDRSVGGPMYTWLAADLASTTQDWIVAFWHHPPYTKGSHDSDAEAELLEMRGNFLPLLEDWGVDLVLCGHSHSYERSFLIDGHYGLSSTFDPATMLLDGGDGDPAGAGSYRPWDVPGAGSVYVVAGSSGKVTSAPLDHPVMVRSLATLGSVILDVDGDVLDARFLDAAGVVRDHFRIEQQPAGEWDDLGGGTAGAAGTPVLEGGGILVDGEIFGLTLAGGPANAFSILFLAAPSTPVSFLGGTLHAWPIVAQFVLFLDAGGGFAGTAIWPLLPPGTQIFYQVGSVDPTVPLYGALLSNGLRSTSP